MPNLLELIEKYRILIGLVLAGSIIVGGFILLRPQEKLSETSVASDIASDQKGQERIAELEKTVAALTERVNELSANQTKNELVENELVEIKEVAGAAVSKTLGSQTASAKSDSTENSKINLNKAGLTELDRLPGIGPTYAQRIIDYRNQNGGFKNITELKNIKGIGDKTFDKLKNQITL